MQQADKRRPPNADKITISKETLTTVTSQGHSQEIEDRKSVCAQMQAKPVQIESNSNTDSTCLAANTGNTPHLFLVDFGDVSVELTSKFHFFLYSSPPALYISTSVSLFFILLIFKTL